MKFDPSIYHLILFLACIVSLTIIITTGHDNSPLLHQIAGGLFGGVIGGSGAGSIPAIANFISGTPNVTPDPNKKQGGHVRYSLTPALLFTSCIALAACASLQQATTANPLAVSCASSSAALKVITTARQTGHLTPADIQGVNTALAVVTPICSAPIEPTSTAVASSALVSAVATLQGIAAHYGTPGG